jgi:hypothetical protein
MLGPLGSDDFVLDFGPRVTCVRCGREREMPDRGPGRMPAVTTPGEGLTVTTDDRCRCGATRVRVRFSFDAG